MFRKECDALRCALMHERSALTNKPIKAKMDFWQQMKTHNARIWCTTPEYMWTMLKKVVDNKMIFEDEDDPCNLNQLNLKDELERRRIWTQGRSYAPVTQTYRAPIRRTNATINQPGEKVATSGQPHGTTSSQDPHYGA